MKYSFMSNEEDIGALEEKLNKFDEKVKELLQTSVDVS